MELCLFVRGLLYICLVALGKIGADGLAGDGCTTDCVWPGTSRKRGGGSSFLELTSGSIKASGVAERDYSALSDEVGTRYWVLSFSFSIISVP